MSFEVSYQMFDMIKVEVDCDVDILRRVNPRSYFRNVVGKQVTEQFPLSNIRRGRFCRWIQ